MAVENLMNLMDDLERIYFKMIISMIKILLKKQIDVVHSS